MKREISKERKVHENGHRTPADESSEAVDVCSNYKKYIYMRIYLWLYEECSVFNLVLVIKDHGYALTIDYIKKK